AMLARLVRGLGSDNIDYRLRQSDFRGDGDGGGRGVAWLGMPVAGLSSLDRALVVGSFLRKDHPLIAARLRVAANKGLQLSMLNPLDDDWLMPIAAKAIVPPSQMARLLAEIVVAAASQRGAAAPAELAGVEASAPAQAIAQSLCAGKHAAILLGNLAEQHRDASQLFALAQALAVITGATLGCLTESANSLGAELAGARPQQGGMNAQAMLADPRKAYVILHAEPEFDCANPLAARAALAKADFVVVMSAFRHAASYADVLLPVSPFTETAGTFVNCEGRAQRFNGVVKPLAATRPAWKVLRVLGTLLGLPGFDFETIDDIRAWAVPAQPAIEAALGNRRNTAIGVPAAAASGVERVADVPIYFSDAIVRRAPSLQLTADARAPRARMHRSLFESLGLVEGAQVKVKQGRGEAVLSAVVDARVPPGVVAVSAAHPSTCHLEGMTGAVTVERA
ncbi:MAG: molybdopterin-dependent oxidoreductase, partial [Casimicrobiaceae bacterium]